MKKLITQHDWSASEISHVLINDQLLDIIKCSSYRKEYESREVVFAVMRCVGNFTCHLSFSLLVFKFSISMLGMFLVPRLSKFGS